MPFEEFFLEVLGLGLVGVAVVARTFFLALDLVLRVVGGISGADAAVDTIIGWILNHVNRFATNVGASDPFELEPNLLICGRPDTQTVTRPINRSGLILKNFYVVSRCLVSLG